MLTCLKDHEEYAKESVDDVIMWRVGHLRIPRANLRQVGAFCGPKRGGSDPENNGSWDDRPPAGVEVSNHVENVTQHWERHGPLAADEVDDERRKEHAREHERDVDGGQPPRAQSLHFVQTALEIGQRLERREQEQETKTHNQKIFDDLHFRHRIHGFGLFGSFFRVVLVTVDCILYLWVWFLWADVKTRVVHSRKY